MQCTFDTFSISLLQEKDAAQIAALEAACFSTAWGEERYREVLRQAYPGWWAVRETGGGTLPPFLALGLKSAGQKLLGYISLGIYSAAQEMEVYNIAVQSDARRQNYGKALLRFALEQCKGLGLSRSVLEVRTGNLPAIALYRSLGFIECGRRKRYYADTGEDALVLEKIL